MITYVEGPPSEIAGCRSLSLLSLLLLLLNDLLVIADVLIHACLFSSSVGMESLLLSLHFEILIFVIVEIITRRCKLLPSRARLAISVDIVHSLALVLGLLPLCRCLLLSLTAICLFKTSFLLEAILEVAILSDKARPPIDLAITLTLILTDNVDCFIGLSIEVLERLSEVDELGSIDSLSLIVTTTHLEMKLLLASINLVLSEALPLGGMLSILIILLIILIVLIPICIFNVCRIVIIVSRSSLVGMHYPTVRLSKPFCLFIVQVIFILSSLSILLLTR